MNYSDIAQQLEAELPDVAALLRGNRAPLTAFIIAAILGTSSEPEAIYRVLDSDMTSAVEKLQASSVPMQVEQLSVPESGAKAEKLDIVSAREMQIEALNKGKGDFANWFAIIVFLSCFAMIGVMLLHGASTINDSMRFYVLGFLQSVVMAIVGFYFGSSAPSRRQHAALLGQNNK